MAPVPTYLKVGFRDDSGRIAERTFRMKVSAEDDGSNMAAVIAARDTIETKLDVLTMDHIEYLDIVIRKVGTGATANDAATNGIVAFVRTTIPTLSYKESSYEVPAWDTVAFEEAKNGILDAAFQTAATNLLANIVDVETGEDMSFDFAQSRSRKVQKRNL